MVQMQFAWVREYAREHGTCREIESELDGLKENVGGLLESGIASFDVVSEAGQIFFGNPTVWMFDAMNRSNI